MANAYIEGKDRVAADESFPYPIKLTYDDENIYLTPLWIPETCKYFDTSTEIQLGTDLQELYNNGELCLCLETRHMRGEMKCGRTNSPKHSSKSDKWHVPGNARNSYLLIEDFVLGTRYSFNIERYLDGLNTSIRRTKSCWQNHSGENGFDPYIKVRGTYRAKVNDNLNWIRRTGVYSNVANVNY